MMLLLTIGTLGAVLSPFQQQPLPQAPTPWLLSPLIGSAIPLALRCWQDSESPDSSPLACALSTLDDSSPTGIIWGLLLYPNASAAVAFQVTLPDAVAPSIEFDAHARVLMVPVGGPGGQHLLYLATNGTTLRREPLDLGDQLHLGGTAICASARRLAILGASGPSAALHVLDLTTGNASIHAISLAPLALLARCSPSPLWLGVVAGLRDVGLPDRAGPLLVTWDNAGAPHVLREAPLAPLGATPTMVAAASGTGLLVAFDTNAHGSQLWSDRVEGPPQPPSGAWDGLAEQQVVAIAFVEGMHV